MDKATHHPRIAFVGLGRLGGPLAANLAEAGFHVTGYDQDPVATGRLGTERIRGADSVAAAIDDAQLVMTCVRSAADLDKVLSAPGVTEALAGVEALLDFSTISPADSAECAERLERHGIAFLRVAVSGSAQAAAARQVSFICSGPKDTYERHTALLEATGRSHTWVGTRDEARAVKIAINMLVGVGMASLIESVALAERLGIGRQQFLDVVAGSAVGSPFFAAKTPALVAHDYTPAASLALMKKDLDLAMAASAEAGVTLPVTQVALDLYDVCAERGWAERDFACLDELYSASENLPSGGAAPTPQEETCRP
ncbi:NAD(P)-dependent oxidoreductase [Actinacidiphila oryziradicis]|uniref:NAD(P)-dependent oxidoreductase n=1 Tax=Actinacidiphila oryziradicis TaxID=2571141 RepID=UPI0023EF8C8F|nr:NAD(P)-dependent oxidoreductase [Actinacidiphila oryziradicis]MCW2870470.1 NAD(P)-dependent oxidoreductase [Actinacidiphila oryziradicis]